MQPSELRNAAIGAAVTVALSFTGLSAVLGGGIAGYLQHVSPRRGARTGAVSGGLAVVPIVLVLALGFVLAVLQPSAVGVTAPLELAIILLVLFPLLIAWIVELSAVGGYVGASLRSDRNAAPDADGVPERD